MKYLINFLSANTWYWFGQREMHAQCHAELPQRRVAIFLTASLLILCFASPAESRHWIATKGKSTNEYWLFGWYLSFTCEKFEEILNVGWKVRLLFFHASVAFDMFLLLMNLLSLAELWPFHMTSIHHAQSFHAWFGDFVSICTSCVGNWILTFWFVQLIRHLRSSEQRFLRQSFHRIHCLVGPFEFILPKKSKNSACVDEMMKGFSLFVSMQMASSMELSPPPDQGSTTPIAQMQSGMIIFVISFVFNLSLFDWCAICGKMVIFGLFELFCAFARLSWPICLFRPGFLCLAIISYSIVIFHFHAAPLGKAGLWTVCVWNHALFHCWKSILFDHCITPLSVSELCWWLLLSLKCPDHSHSTFLLLWCTIFWFSRISPSLFHFPMAFGYWFYFISSSWAFTCVVSVAATCLLVQRFGSKVHFWHDIWICCFSRISLSLFHFPMAFGCCF